MRYGCGALFAAVLALCACIAQGDDEPDDTRPSLLNDEWYTEGWDQLFYFPDGSLVVVQFTVYNMGFGDEHAAVFGIVVGPDGEANVMRQSRGKGEWTFADDAFDIRIAENRLSGAQPDFQVTLKKNEGEIDLRFRADTPPWRIGRTVQTRRDYRYLSLYAPMASASGRFRFNSTGELEQEPWRPLTGGRGFAARYVNSTGLWDLIQDSTRIVPLGDSTVSPALHTVHDDDGKLLTYLALFEGGELIHQADGFDLSIAQQTELAAGDSRQVPHRFEVDLHRDDFSLNGTITADRLLLRVDPVDWVKPPVQYLLKRLNTPIQYRYLASYDLNYKDGTRSIRLQGEALMDHIVMRHERGSFQEKRER